MTGSTVDQVPRVARSLRASHSEWVSPARGLTLLSLVSVFAVAACEPTRVSRHPTTFVPLEESPKTNAAPKAPAPAKAVTAPILAAGEPVVGFDGTKFHTAFYAPVSLAVKNDRFDLIIHFHGKHQTTVDALEQSGLPAALVNVDIGVGSQIYRGAYDDAGSLDHVIEFAERALHENGRLPNARVGRVAISAWSAGYGAARVILTRPAEAARVDALVLEDALFADWDPKRPRARAVSMDGLAPTVAFATKATRGEKLFFVTHTAITQGQYAGAPECADALMRHFDVAKGIAPANAHPFGGAPVYTADLADFHIRGYDGKTFNEHAEQHRAMGSLHFAELRKYWERRP